MARSAATSTMAAAPSFSWQQSNRWNGSTIQRDVVVRLLVERAAVHHGARVVLGVVVRRQRDRPQRLRRDAVVVHEAVDLHGEHLRRPTSGRTATVSAPSPATVCCRGPGRSARTGPGPAPGTPRRTRPARWRSRRRALATARRAAAAAAAPLHRGEAAARWQPSAADSRDGSLRSLLYEAKPSTSRGIDPGVLGGTPASASMASLNSGSGERPCRSTPSRRRRRWRPCRAGCARSLRRDQPVDRHALTDADALLERRGVDLLELDLAGSAPPASTPGAPAPWRGTPASPRAANSSRLAQMSSCVLRPAWLSRMTWSTLDFSNLRSFRRMVSGEPISPPRSAALASRDWPASTPGTRPTG